MLRISPTISIPERELVFTAVRAGGPGGQNVNRVASAVQLRFDIRASSLPADCRERLLSLADRRITADGVLVIHCREHRTQERNRAAARARLAALLRRVLAPRRPRIPGRPGPAAARRRLEDKARRARLKRERGIRPEPE
jgi:ribosome-associated protein